jgi:hypothetical protein
VGRGTCRTEKILAPATFAPYQERAHQAASRTIKSPIDAPSQASDNEVTAT